MTEFPPALAEVAHHLREAQEIAVLTGAGISAESGVPTFRDAQTGIWAKYDPMQLATPEAFAADPKRVWEWYAWRRGLVAEAKPNPGHLALANLEGEVPALTLITQNVDRLHHRAGSKNVVELHGNLEEDRCSHENCVVRADPSDNRTPPHCPRCEALLRPNVVWFGEALSPAALERSFNAAGNCDLFLCIGTSSLVYPAADLPMEALNRGATVVEINADPTPLSPHATYCLQGKAGTLLPAISALAFPAITTNGSPA